MSIERELGQLTEAVSSLKEKVESIDVKLDKHLENYEWLKVKVVKLATTVALVTALFFAGTKEMIAKILKGE